MGTNYGIFEGDWSKWKPNYITGCTLWEDHKDESTVIINSSNELAAVIDKSSNLSTETLFNNNTINYNYDSYTSVSNGFDAVKTTTGSGDFMIYGVDMSPDPNSHYGETYVVKFDLIINSYTGDGLRLGMGGSNTNALLNRSLFTESITPITTSGRKTVNIVRDSTGDNSIYLKFLCLSADTIDFTVRNLVICRVNANTFAQEGNSSARPDWDPYLNNPIYNVSTDYLIGSNWTDNFKDDTQGEWFGVIQCPSVHVNNMGIGWELDSSYHYLGIEPEDGSMRLTLWSFGNGTNKIKGTTYLNINIPYLFNISSNGSRYRMAINDRDEPVEIITGTDNGNWISSLGGADVMQKGRFTGAGTIYRESIQTEEIYYNRELTNKERKGVFRYLREKHFNPTLLGPKIKIWMDGSDFKILTLDASNLVEQWRNKGSLNTNHANQTDPNIRPEYEPSTGSVKFSASLTTHLNFTAANVMGAVNTVYIKFLRGTSGEQNLLAEVYDFLGTNIYRAVVQSTVGPEINGNNTSSESFPVGYNVLKYERQDGSIGGNTLWLNGIQSSSSAAINTWGNSAQFRIGVRGSGATLVNHYTGNIKQIIISDEVLSDAEDAQIMKFLASK